MEVRRAGDHHHVDAALDHLLVGVETDERVRVVHHELVGVHLLQLRPGSLDPLGEDVGHGHQAHVLAGVHGVGGRSAAPAAAADQPDLDHVAAGGMDAAGQRQNSISRRPGNRTVLEKLAS